jgi:hypothetical protein
VRLNAKHAKIHGVILKTANTIDESIFSRLVPWGRDLFGDESDFPMPGTHQGGRRVVAQCVEIRIDAR